MGGPHFADTSAPSCPLLSSPILPLLSQSPTPNSSPKFMFQFLPSFQLQHPLKSKRAALTLLSSSKVSIGLGSPTLLPRSQQHPGPPQLWTGFCKRKGDFNSRFLLTLILKSLELACRRALCPHSLLVGCVTWWVERERSGNPFSHCHMPPPQQPTRQTRPGGQSPGNGVARNMEWRKPV